MDGNIIGGGIKRKVPIISTWDLKLRIKHTESISLLLSTIYTKELKKYTSTMPVYRII